MSTDTNEDCAWVIIPVPFGVEQLSGWLDEVEILFRINSMLEISDWREEGSCQVHLMGRNLSNDHLLDLRMSLEHSNDRLLVKYADGLKCSTAFAVEACDTTNSMLRITDDYSGLSEEERRLRIDEVDRSLPQWGRDISKFFRAWHRWSWFTPWRWYKMRLWLRMKPTARRITRWIWWITAAEVIAFLLVFMVLLIEQG